MKIIEGMKRIKYLKNKIEDLKKKISEYCFDYDYEKPHYESEDKQRAQINEWIQSCIDSIKEMMRLRISIQRTNLATPCTIELGNKQITQSIAEWIHRKRDLCEASFDVWACLSVKGKKNFVGYKDSKGEDAVTHIRLYFDQKEVDKNRAIYQEEPSLIDATLEIVNAVTDLIEG